ncbi:hypothetical protein [Gallaecimonas mangrovi]|uniref:hypothetical protein n=1 Tax=Gallaecimonas mangrovi TaxID=2291597 RepID=UPI000E20897F|nr:hypothetical protein [Gallaecimonas mangrovi]
MYSCRPSNNAVGLCKHCYRYVSQQNLIDTGWGIVCSEACAKELEVSRNIVAVSAESLSQSKPTAQVYAEAISRNKKFHSSMVVTWALGLLFSIMQSLSKGDKDYPITFAAIFFVLIFYSLLKIKINNAMLKKLAKLL